jgi:serine/threonine-protein kinase
VSRRLLTWVAAGFTFLILVCVTFVLLNYALLPRFVRLGRETAVPDVRTLPVREARGVLRLSGLPVSGVRSAYHASLPEGYVMETAPHPWMAVKEGRKVELVVSAGPRLSEVPYLFRTTQKISEIRLREQGLWIGELRKEYNDSVPVGLVISAEPEFGCTLQWGDTVSLLVSLGKRLITVPDLTGMTVREAKEALRELGLVLDTGMILDPGRRIEAQSPSPGREVVSGSEIIIQVGRP